MGAPEELGTEERDAAREGVGRGEALAATVAVRMEVAVGSRPLAVGRLVGLRVA